MIGIVPVFCIWLVFLALALAVLFHGLNAESLQMQRVWLVIMGILFLCSLIFLALTLEVTI